MLSRVHIHIGNQPLGDKEKNQTKVLKSSQQNQTPGAFLHSQAERRKRKVESGKDFTGIVITSLALIRRSHITEMARKCDSKVPCKEWRFN